MAAPFNDEARAPSAITAIDASGHCADDVSRIDNLELERNHATAPARSSWKAASKTITSDNDQVRARLDEQEPRIERSHVR